MRTPYCTGCGHTFSKMHLMINHRRTDRCGGRFLPDEEQERLKDLRLERERVLREARTEALRLKAI